MPRQLRVELLNQDGTWLEHRVVNNGLALEAAWFSWGGPGSATSAPVTMTFSTAVTRRVRFVMDTCSTLKDPELAAYLARQPGSQALGNGWLYEIFAELSRWEAWRRWLFGD